MRYKLCIRKTDISFTGHNIEITANSKDIVQNSIASKIDILQKQFSSNSMNKKLFHINRN